jgi:translation elongation factor EF-Ts
MALDLNKLKQLREDTGVSFALCKKALEQTDNNIEQAKKKLEEWSGEKLLKTLRNQFLDSSSMIRLNIHFSVNYFSLGPQ